MPYPLGHRTLHAKPRKDHTECGACRKIKTKEEKMTGGGFEPATLASAVGLLARRSLTRCRKCPEADGSALPYSRQSPYRLVVRMSCCSRDNPGSTPAEDISLGQSEEKKTCLHHCIISRNLQLDSLFTVAQQHPPGSSPQTQG